MNEAFLCDAIRTPFGRYGGSLSSVRTDDLAAAPLRALTPATRTTEPALREELDRVRRQR